MKKILALFISTLILLSPLTLNASAITLTKEQANELRDKYNIPYDEEEQNLTQEERNKKTADYNKQESINARLEKMQERYYSAEYKRKRKKYTEDEITAMNEEEVKAEIAKRYGGSDLFDSYSNLSKYKLAPIDPLNQSPATSLLPNYRIKPFGKVSIKSLTPNKNIYNSTEKDVLSEETKNCYVVISATWYISELKSQINEALENHSKSNKNKKFRFNLIKSNNEQFIADIKTNQAEFEKENGIGSADKYIQSVKEINNEIDKNILFSFAGKELVSNNINNIVNVLTEYLLKVAPQKIHNKKTTEKVEFKILLNYTVKNNTGIGNDFKVIYYINNKKVYSDDTLYFKKGEKIKLSAYVAEMDTYPDVSKVSGYFYLNNTTHSTSATLYADLTEYMGRANKGATATVAVDFTFIP